MDAESILNDYQPMVVGLSRRLTSNETLQQDLQQEARIAIWKALTTFNDTKGALPAWLRFKAKNAMFRYFRDQSARNRDAIPKDIPTALAQGASEERQFMDLSSLVVDPEHHLVSTYHGNEIIGAVKALSPRQKEYVFMRFWLGYNTPELKLHFGYDPSGLWGSPKNGAKRKLASSLSHLKGE